MHRSRASIACGVGDSSSIICVGKGVLVGEEDVDRVDGVGVRSSRDGGAPQLVRTNRKSSIMK